MKIVEKFWQQRSQLYGTKIEGVLLKSVPLAINKYLHQWMLQQVSTQVEKNENLQVLDIGCGYGRVSSELLHLFPKINTFGVDIAQQYVDLYNQHLAPRGKALRGDLCQLPFKDKTFDMIFMVTTLMYLSDISQQQQALKEICRVLKPKGKFVIIERNPSGYGIFTLWGLIGRLRGQKHSEIPAVSFSPEKMKQLVEASNLKLLKKQGLPFFTLFFYLLLIANLINHISGRMGLTLISYFDRFFSKWINPSLYIAYSGVKK